MSEAKLKACPFCNGRPEMDSHRAYRALSGKMGTSVAIYCTNCDADMTLCREDMPECNGDELMEMLAANWNKRAGDREPAASKMPDESTLASAQCSAIRRMTSSDIAGACSIIGENYDMEAYELAREEMLSALKGSTPAPIYLVAVENLRIVAVAGVADSFMNQRIFEIFWVNVKMSHQHKGMGTLIVSELLKVAFGMGAESVILTAKHSLIPFYERLGFKVRGIIGHDRFDDYMMEACPVLPNDRTERPEVKHGK